MSEVLRPAFDHCYRPIDEDQVFKDFESRGFLLNPVPVIHPGRLKCQFLHFKSPAGLISYLEFIFKDETLPSTGPEEELPHAGFALKVPKDMSQVFETFQREFSSLKPKLEHRNYERTADESARLPGWNFLEFDEPPISDMEVWLIEYERRPNLSEEELAERQRRMLALGDHPNGARRILGFIWDGLGERDYQAFKNLTASEHSNRGLLLEGGTMVYFLKDGDSEAEHFQKKTGTFLAVVLGVESLELFVKSAKPDDMVEVLGRKAARIRLGDDSWDIIAIEVEQL